MLKIVSVFIMVITQSGNHKYSNKVFTRIYFHTVDTIGNNGQLI